VRPSPTVATVLIEQAPPTTGVRARGVHRAFGSVQAVRGIDLDAPAGEVTALVGPNGAGKTTLMLVLASLLVPDAGFVRVAGFDPVTEPDQVRARMGWSPDVFGLYDTLTAYEYLDAMAEAYRIPAHSRALRVQELLEIAYLTDKIGAPVHTLSRGQKQRLGLVRALIHDPEVLILDEPAAGLDPRSRVDLRDLLRAQATSGKTVVVSSHILGDLEELADRVVFIDAGATVGQHRMTDLPAAQTTRTYRVRALETDAMVAALRRLGVRYSIRSGGVVDIELAGGEAWAARLLTNLVQAGIEITSFAPLGGALEAAYLDITDNRT